jgi:hypothetical protein
VLAVVALVVAWPQAAGGTARLPGDVARPWRRGRRRETATRGPAGGAREDAGGRRSGRASAVRRPSTGDEGGEAPTPQWRRWPGEWRGWAHGARARGGRGAGRGGGGAGGARGAAARRRSGRAPRRRPSGPPRQPARASASGEGAGARARVRLRARLALDALGRHPAGLLADVRDLLVDPVARIARGDDLLQPAAPAPRASGAIVSAA